MSVITNRYDAGKARPALAAEKIMLYRPEADWSYSHHASITHYNGKFHAIWSNGRVNEDDTGQRILLSVSRDFYHWSEPRPLADSQMGEHSELVLTAAGFHQHGDKLNAYYGQFEYIPENIEDGHAVRPGVDHMNTALYALTTGDGEHWSDPVPMHLPVVPNHGPQATSSGRLIISGNISFPYTDDPSGLSSWRMCGIYPPQMAQGIYDDSASHKIVHREAGWPCGLCEGSFYETDDGVIHMLLRSIRNPNTRLWVTESRDNGETWTAPEETDFTDNNAKFHFGRLPDGRFYHVGSPDPEGRRCPLVLSLSEDGIVFERSYIIADRVYTPRMEGRHKGGVYGYPHTLVSEGYIYVICSICKEDVAVFRFRYEGL